MQLNINGIIVTGTNEELVSIVKNLTQKVQAKTLNVANTSTSRVVKNHYKMKEGRIIPYPEAFPAVEKLKRLVSKYGSMANLAKQLNCSDVTIGDHIVGYRGRSQRQGMRKGFYEAVMNISEE